MTHLLILLYLSVKLIKFPLLVFGVMADTRFVSDKPLTFDSDLDLGNLTFEVNTPSHFALFFCAVRLNSVNLFLNYG